LIKWSFLIVAGLLMAPVVHSIEMGIDDLRVDGYVDGGRFQDEDSLVDGEVLSRMGAKWTIDKSIDENWSLLANLHWMWWRNQATDVQLNHITRIKFDADMLGALKYQDERNRFRVGLYEFKYNPDSKNLGEYLLRSGAYPTILESAQGKDLMSLSHNKVMGVEYGLGFPLFRQTALVYLEQSSIPVNDLSAAYFAAVGPQKTELELGVSYSRFLKTGTPMKDDNLGDAQRKYIEDQGLVFKSVRFSLRGRLDFAAMMEWEDNFKLYGEVALLGLKNDSLFYKNMMERVPMMVGLDIPTGGILDMLSFELEYFSNPYADKKYGSSDAGGSKFSPLPSMPNYSNIPNYTRDDMKWSLYLHKSLNKWLDLKVRAANDHLRLKNWEGDSHFQPLTMSPKEWYVFARIEFHN
jgi:hypothetical protein